jgi:hypothetical protein
MCLQYILVRFTPSIILPLLRIISTGFFLLFSYMNTKYIHHIHPHSPFLTIILLPLVPTPGKDLFYPPVLLFVFFFLSVY